MITRVHPLWLIAWLLLPPAVSAQGTGEMIEQSLEIGIPFTAVQYSTKDGLPQNQVIDITSKSDEALILATGNGLVEFNGYTFHPVFGEEYLVTRYFNGFTWLRNKTILLGYNKGRQLCQLLPEFRLLSRRRLIHSFADDGILYILFEPGELVLVSEAEGRILKTYPLQARGLYTGAVMYPYIYLGGTGGLEKLDLRSGQQQHIADEPMALLQKAPSGNLLFGAGDSRVFSIGTSVKKIFDATDFGLETQCEDIVVCDATHLFIATIDGLFFLSDGRVTRYYKGHGLSSSQIYSLHYDREQNCLFAGTAERGMLKLEWKSCFTYAKQQGWDFSSVNSVVQLHEGKILAAENCCHIYEVLEDTLRQYTSLTGNFASLGEVKDTLYAGIWGGPAALLYNGQQVGEMYYDAGDPRNQVVMSTFSDSRGNLWMGTMNGVFTGRHYRDMHPFLPGKITGKANLFYERRNGDVCIGGTDGLYLVRDKKLVGGIYRSNDFMGMEIRAFYEDREGKLWIGSYNGGLYCLDRDHLTHINSMPGCMLDKDAFCLAPDTLGYIYMTSNHGLWRVAERDLDDFYDGRLGYLIPYHYGEENGILNAEFNGGFGSNFLHAQDHRFYFPSMEGLVKTIPEKPGQRRLVPRIDGIQVNDLPVPVSDGLVLERSTFSVQVDFSCVNFQPKNNVYFQHKLIGRRQSYGWSAPQKSTSVYLKMLPPGDYTFEVRALDGMNDRQPLEATLHFTIKPYFYETGWFFFLAVVAIVTILTVAVNRRLVWVRKKAAAEEQVMRSLAEYELKAIQAQMNPHFIFNCLSSIKYFVLSGQKQSADKFLDHFASLIRKFLELSDHVYSTVAEEVAILNEYLELEKMRFGGNLDYSIEADELTRGLPIPTMLTQPFVENAIKHGIAHLETTGRVIIRYTANNGTLLITVDDNGIGRKKAGAIQDPTWHTSRGMGLVEEKSYLMKKLHDLEIAIHVVDKYDEEGNATGTRVEIRINQFSPAI